MQESVLRELQLTQLEILKYVTGICEEYGLKYSLYAGTLLGAVRHKGFIPWDDDLDICMPRDDYNRLIELWPKIASEKYILQNKDNTPEFPQDFTKIRKYNSTFVTEDDMNYKYHRGIFIDIFPVDRVDTKWISKYVFYVKVMLYQLMLREFVPKESGVLLKCGSILILKIVPKRRRTWIRRKLLNSLTKYNDNKRLDVVMFETVREMKKTYCPELLEQYTQLEFEGEFFDCFLQWDYYLKKKYGNYRELPAESERKWKHKPLEISFINCPKGYER